MTLGDSEYTPDTAFEKPVHRVENVPHDEHALKAMGCALARKKEVLVLWIDSAGFQPHIMMRRELSMSSRVCPVVRVP